MGARLTALYEEAPVKLRDFLPVLTAPAEGMTVFAGINLVGLIFSAEHPNLAQVFLMTAGFACSFSLLAILVRFRSPLRWVLCLLLGLCQVFAITWANDPLNLQQVSMHSQRPTYWSAVVVMVFCLTLHQAAYLAVCLLSPQRSATRANPQGGGPDVCGGQFSGERSQ
jgi:hypothetical protein